ncbi:MAG: bacteriocin fulvocin C-related protein [Chloracidobacterium sp.]|nr:bacteriocin fulvocin C-related protein [Chloracidobacterium sp.]MDW8217857.1 bacteriocin fulvocin C-related protein [Acidobacteriota bacterium]
MVRRRFKKGLCVALLSGAICFWPACAPWKRTETHTVTPDERVKSLLAMIDGMALHIEEGKAGKPYENYMGLPLELRREVYVRLTPETKAAIWKGHFRYCLASLPLTPQQQACVSKADELMSAELYKPFADIRGFTAPIEGFRQAFEPTLFAFVFYGEEPSVGGQQRGLFSMRPDPRLQSAAGCNCRTYVGRAANCGGMSTSCGDSDKCSPYNSCGPGGTQTCDGLCSIN